MTAIIDCNSFYCSCEQLFLPALKHKPVVVLSNNDGCIVSRTDEAKALGIGMGEPYFQSKEQIKKHQIAVFSSNYHLYGDLSRRVMDTLRHLVGTKEVEVYSVDEAFVDLKHIPNSSLNALAEKMRKVTEQWTGIPVSVGIAPTKVLSKVANRLAKKNKQATGCIMILQTKEEIQQALEQTPVGDIWGIGRRYAYLLREMYGIETALQLRNMNEGWVQKNLGGVVRQRLLRELKGEPCIEMKDPLEKKKMIATTRMFGKPVSELNELKEAVATYVTRAAEKLRRQYGAAATIHVFVVNKPKTKYNAEYYTESNSKHITMPVATNDTRKLIAYALPLVYELFEEGKTYIKAGVILSDIIPDTSIQGNLFYEADDPSDKQLLKAIDNINFGVREDMVRFGSAGTTRNWKMRQEHRSKKYTTRWNELFEVP
ncbi:MAG: Y-family DNA polymerase [Bacteroidota bacterium]|jgi:DNA polymerase V